MIQIIFPTRLFREFLSLLQERADMAARAPVHETTSLAGHTVSSIKPAFLSIWKKLAAPATGWLTVTEAPFDRNAANGSPHWDP